MGSENRGGVWGTYLADTEMTIEAVTSVRSPRKLGREKVGGGRAN